MSESAITPRGLREVLPNHEDGLSRFENDKLSYSVPPTHEVSVVGVGVHEDDLYLAAVAAVDQTRCVEAGDAVICGQSAPRKNHRAVSLGKLDGHSGADTRAAAARGEFHICSRHQIGTCITGVGI